MIDEFKRVAINNSKVAIIEGNNKITYLELIEKVKKYADYLTREDSGIVAIYGHKEIEMIISILSCIMSHRPYVILDNSLPKERIKKIIEITKARLLIKVEEIDDLKVKCLKLDELKVYQNDRIKDNNNDVVYIVFTSGSTGLPKGVQITYKNLTNFINWIKKLLGNNNEYIFNTANFNFDLSVADIFYALWSGKTLIINNTDKLMNLDKANLIVATPTFMKMCLLDNEFNDENYSNLKNIFFCGERLDNKVVKKLFDRFRGLRIINAYGPSEATCAVSAIDITKDMISENNLPIGDINNLATEVEIDNGEIILKGESVFKGYLGSLNTFSDYHTGDIGYIENNKLYLNGRIDNQIKYKGYRIELEEIEKNILLIDGVIDVVVVPISNEDNTILYLKAYIVGVKDKNIIINYLKKILPSYMIPKSFVFLDKLPINMNNKVDRKLLENDRC